MAKPASEFSTTGKEIQISGGSSPQENFRYERKFLISEFTTREVESIVKLHPAIFSERYAPRVVNNLYFDSFDLRDYFDSADGTKSRVKTRIRWYGDLFGFIEKPVLELKIKEGWVGRKELYPLIPFAMDEHFQFQTVVYVVKNSEVPDVVKTAVLSVEPALLNSYTRQYYASADGNFRITIDSDMAFYRVNSYYNSFLHKSVDKVHTVLELKYDCDNDHRADWITRHFPFRVTKSSKYLSGIERLGVW